MKKTKPALDSMWRAQISKQVEESISAKQLLLRDDALLAQIEQLSRACLDALRAGGKIIFAGNGGSFADSQHLSAEFTCRFMFDRAPLASLALGTNASAISAISNDYGYENVFARELRGIGRREDVFIPISTSGNSPNILAAVDVARDLDIPTFGLTGAGGGTMKARSVCLRAPATETARIQECHILIGHIVCSLVEAAYFEQ